MLDTPTIPVRLVPSATTAIRSRLYMAAITPQWSLHIRGCADGDLVPVADWHRVRVVRYYFHCATGDSLASAWYTMPANTRLLAALIQILPSLGCQLDEVTPMWATSLGDLVPQDF
jgi:hypothetical protein